MYRYNKNVTIVPFLVSIWLVVNLISCHHFQDLSANMGNCGRKLWQAICYVCTQVEIKVNLFLNELQSSLGNFWKVLSGIMLTVPLSCSLFTGMSRTLSWLLMVEKPQRKKGQQLVYRPISKARKSIICDCNYLRAKNLNATVSQLTNELWIDVCFFLDVNYMVLCIRGF